MVDRDAVLRLYEPYWTGSRGPAFECGDGWLGILDGLIRQIGGTGQSVEFLQIKEKFGSLRVYATTGSSEVLELIVDAERASMVTCELCGEAGVDGHKGGWWSVRCSEHAPDGWEAADESD